MNNEAMKEVLNELFFHLERLETQSEAILQFLKEKKRVTDKQLAPYLEQAGNASNVKWRAARVRIDHLLEPEHPEKKIKLGKKPELHEEPARAEEADADSVAALADDKRTELGDKEGKKTESKNAEANGTDVSEKEKPKPVEAAQASPADGGSGKSEMKSESSQEKKEQAPQAQSHQKSESVHHPTEVTEPLAQREGAEPAAQLESKEKGSDQEAA
ncbi:MAG TPA: hypothetical protein VGK36_14560 [Candidatus Angelobacter sp.]|jgi:hypothetical protein